MLVKTNISNTLLNIAAVLTGLAIPSLVLGRATIGVVLGLALICVVVGADHKNNWSVLKKHLNVTLLYLLGLTLVGTALNIPFSIRTDLSIEAWARSWLILSATFYLIFSLRHRIGHILKSLVIGLILALLLISYNTLDKVRPSKPVLNGFLLALPVAAYYCFKDKHRTWMFGGCMILALHLWHAATRPAKASIAGLILMIIIGIFFSGLVHSNWRKTLPLMGGVTISIIVGLIFWLPETMNHSSQLYGNLTPFPVWAVDLHRQLIWVFATDLLADSPLVGYGLNASNYHPAASTTVAEYFGPKFENLQGLSSALLLPSHPHNWVIEFLVDAGLLGFIPVFLLVCGIFIITIKAYFKTKHPALLVLIAINVGYWGTGLLNFSFWSVWWQVTYFVSSFIMTITYMQQKQEHPDE